MGDDCSLRAAPGSLVAVSTQRGVSSGVPATVFTLGTCRCSRSLLVIYGLVMLCGSWLWKVPVLCGDPGCHPARLHRFVMAPSLDAVHGFDQHRRPGV